MTHLAIILLVFVAACTGKNPSTDSSSVPLESELPIVVEKPFPDIELLSLDKSVIKFSQYKGKVSLINFWASWCAPCEEEMPGLQKLHELYGAQNFQVVSINVDQNSAKAIEKFRTKFKLGFPIFIDPEGRLMESLQILGIPFNVLVDKKLLVQKITPGYEDWNEKSNLELIKELLTEK